MNGNCYTYPLIIPEVSIVDPVYEDHMNPKANSLNCLNYALIYDNDFIEDCEQATLYAISEYQKEALKALKEELAPPTASITLNLYGDDGNDLTTLQSALIVTPFCELIIHSIPVNKIRVETEQILWY